MEDRRFDDLTKLVGRRASRRTVVKGVAAALAAAMLGRAVGDNVAEAAVIQQGGVKQRVRAFCNQAGQPCKNSLNPTRRCCYRCAGSGKHATCCEAEGYACTQDQQCCDGLICRDPNLSDGVNLKGCFQWGDLPAGAQCIESGECATDSCVEGRCAECTVEGAMECLEDASGFRTCDHGVWVERACAPGTECKPMHDGIVCDFPTE